MTREPIATEQAPAAIGSYSQAIRCGDTVYLSGVIVGTAPEGVVIRKVRLDAKAQSSP